MNRRITKRMPQGSWMYIDTNGKWRYTALYRLVTMLAAKYDNAAIEQNRPYKDYILEKVQRDLMQFDIEFIPSVSSLRVYCNSQRNTKFGIYQQTEEVKSHRAKILQKVSKK